jgi:chromosome segregation ATPase
MKPTIDQKIANLKNGINQIDIQIKNVTQMIGTLQMQLEMLNNQKKSINEQIIQKQKMK